MLDNYVKRCYNAVTKGALTMDFLNRLKLLMDKAGDNNSTLAKKSGIPYTTIDGLFKRGWEKAQISTIQKICEYYKVSLDYMVYGSDALSDESLMMAAKYEGLSKHGREIVMVVLETEANYQMQQFQESFGKSKIMRSGAAEIPDFESATGVPVGHPASAQAWYNAVQEQKELAEEESNINLKGRART